MATASIQKRREILDSAKGQTFSVTFVKSDGSVRTMQAKKWIEKAFASGDKTKVEKSNVPPQNYSLVDLEAYKADPKKSFRSLKLANLKSACIAGITYNF